MIYRAKRWVLWTFLGMLFAGGLLNGTAPAKTIIVPVDALTINGAVALADEGDVIEVQAGQTCTENVVLKAGVSLVSSSPDITLIQAASSALPVISLPQGDQEGSNLVTEIRGFKISGGSIGIKIDAGDPNDLFKKIQVIISGNWITDNDSTGIDVQTKLGGPHWIVNNLVTHHRDAGITVNSPSHVVNNTVDQNGFPGDGGSRIATGINFANDNASGSTLFNNNVTNNEGDGLFVLSIPGVLEVDVSPIEANNFWGNGGLNANTPDDVFAGGQNISENPQYSQAGPVTPFDYMPLSSSPCLDRGVNSALDLGRFSLDLTQSPGGRVYPTDGTIDIGAVEYNPHPFGQVTPTSTPTRTPTPTVTPLETRIADLNRDGYINDSDLFILQQQWHSITPTPSNP